MTRPITECPSWRWMPGMFWISATETCPLCHGHGGHRWMGPDGEERGEECPCAGRLEHYPGFTVGHDMGGAVPDPDDPATVGCLLALVREAWGMPGLGVHHDRLIGEWVFADVLSLPEPLREVFTATEWDALCVALWAASERAP